MKKSSRSEDKSVYLAFALCPSITFETLLDRQNSQDRQFHFQLCKGNSILEKTSTFGIETINLEPQMYLYLCLPQYAEKLTETYSIKLIDETEEPHFALLDEKINLDHYIREHKTQQRDFWTEVHKTSNETQKIILKQRVFLKRTKFQLDDIMNSSEKGEELDTVEVPDYSSGVYKSSKFAVDRRKSKSYQASLNNQNGFVSPLRLDTISEEDSNIPFTDKKQRDSFGSKQMKLKKFSTSYQKADDFEYQLEKKSTWIQKNNNFDDDFITAFDSGNNHEAASKSKFGNQNELIPDFALHLKAKSTTQSEISQKGSKISKNTKDSEKQLQDNSISFLEKSSLLLDMDQSELSISANQEIEFKIKWIILVIVILSLAFLASLSTDAFDITGSGKQKQTMSKIKVQKSKAKNKKTNKNKPRKQVHA